MELPFLNYYNQNMAGHIDWHSLAAISSDLLIEGVSNGANDIH